MCCDRKKILDPFRCKGPDYRRMSGRVFLKHLQSSHSLRELSLSCFFLVICKLVLTLPDTLAYHRLWLLELVVIPCSSSQRGSEEQRRRCGLPRQVSRLLAQMLTGDARTVSVKNPCSSCMHAYAHMATWVQHIILRENTPA